MSEEFIGKYRIEERLGSGTFATVYRCYDPDLDTVCAIKVLAENWSEDETARNWFLNEARVMFGIEHPSILRIFTSGSLEDGRPYFVMEYADQGSLADTIRDRRSRGERFDTAEALGISIAIAEGLSIAHNRGLVHRDLKPSNVLFRTPPEEFATTDKQGRPDLQLKLADFGLARRLEQGANSLAGAGTPHYIAPEQARGLADEHPDVRNDIYSAATILYELLAGQVPFPYTSMTQVIAAHLDEEPTPVQDLAPDVPGEVAQVIHAGLAKDPEYRVPTALAWRQQLQVLRTALNPDGSISGWESASITGAAAIPDTEAAAQKIKNQEALTVPAGGLTATQVQPGDPGADKARPAERSNPLVPYVIAAVFAGILVVGLLGYALTELMDTTSDSTPNGTELAADADDNDDLPGEGTDSDAAEETEPTATPEPDPTPTEEASPSPTATPEPTPEPETDPAAEDVAQTLQSLPGIASSAVSLPSGERVDDSGDREVAAASTIKLWIAATAFEESAQGDLDLDESHTIRSEDQAPGTGILNRSEYLGREMPFSDLIEFMLLYSDNSAANIIIDQVGGLDRITEYASDHGYEQTRVQRYLGDLDPNRENYTSAQDGVLFMERLLDGEIVDEASSSELRAILERRSSNETTELDFFGRNLPSDVAYAHISGLLPNTRNEIGYYFSDEQGGYVVVSFMLADLPDEVSAEDSISNAVAEINSHLRATSANTS